MDTFTKHQIKIAKSTLKMSDSGARIMGGMTKDEARAILRKNGYSDQAIRSMEESEITLNKELKIGNVIIEKGDIIEVIKESTPTPQEVADALDGVSLMSARSILEPMFGKRNVDFNHAGAPHFQIKTPEGTLVIINQKYVEPDDDIVYSGELAIGYI